MSDAGDTAAGVHHGAVGFPSCVAFAGRRIEAAELDVIDHAAWLHKPVLPAGWPPPAPAIAERGTNVRERAGIRP